MKELNMEVGRVLFCVDKHNPAIKHACILMSLIKENYYDGKNELNLYNIYPMR